MGYDEEIVERERLLQEYDSLMNRINYRKLSFRSRRNYKEFEGHYERYKHILIHEKPYLNAANRAFSKKIGSFKKLIGGRNE